jgi:outer membrane protein OmpA-like peptidoglycan-associated protein
MIFNNVCRKAGMALIASAYMLLVESVWPVQAQTRAIVRWSQSGSYAATITKAARIVIHGVRFQSEDEKIDQRSLPVLNCGARILKQNTEPLVYVEVHIVGDRRQDSVSGNSTLTKRRAHAVVTYLERRGVSPGRLILLGSGNTAHSAKQDDAEAQSPERNVEVVRLVYLAIPSV